MCFFVGDRLMLDAPRRDKEPAFVDHYLAIAQAHPQQTADHEKHFIFMLVMVADEFPLKPRKLYTGEAMIAGS